jgi:predicted PurR-regulated permease PerM
VVMSVLSLLPAVGAALVWAPVAIYLIATGSMIEGLGLAAWGAGVMGMVDNLLRPILVGKETKLPDYLVLLSTIGGLSIFGVNGFLIGPAIAALFVATWALFSHEEGATPEDAAVAVAAAPADESAPPPADGA